MAKKRRSNKRNQNLYRILFLVLYFGITLIAFLQEGQVGQFFDKTFNVLFGNARSLIYVVTNLYLIKVTFFRKLKFKFKYWLAFLISINSVFLWIAYFALDPQTLSLTVLKSWPNEVSQVFDGTLKDAVGLLGRLWYALSTYLFGRNGTLFLLIGLSIFVLILLIDVEVIKNIFTKEVEIDDAYDDASNNDPKTSFITLDEDKTPKTRRSKKTIEEVKTYSAATIETIGNYALPSIGLLDEVSVKAKSSANTQAASIKGKRLIEILNEFGVSASLVATHIGPSVTKFELKPESNVKISKIASIQDNLKMELAAKELRIEAPIPGRNAVGVEIPNVEMNAVKMIEMMRDIPKEQSIKKMLYPLGKDLMGKGIYAEMDKMPHLLVAGSTGSGKSVFMNTMIINYLLRTSPDELKMLLIDPKKVEFTPFINIPHLIAPVISDAAEATRALKIIVGMMENRYEVFSNLGVRNITAYNELLIKKPQEHLQLMPWILVVIDELADLMMVAGKDVEASIQRITQLARAAGIHLVVATQRPSTDVITGIIKANIPSRIAFEVSNGIDSRTILDQVGAERLLGKGDMLFYPVGEPAPMRVQGAFISDDEVHRITQAVSEKRKPVFDESFLNLNDPEATNGTGSKLDDPLYEEVKEYILETGRASTSNIQRRFGLGYNRAARMIDQMENEGLVGPAMGSKPRDVFKR